MIFALKDRRSAQLSGAGMGMAAPRDFGVPSGISQPHVKEVMFSALVGGRMRCSADGLDLVWEVVR